MIKGVLNAERPTIVGVLSIPRLELSGFVPFLVDTGADGTVIHPRDAINLGVRHRRHFAAAEAASSEGIGGKAEQWWEPCDIFLAHEDGHWDQISLNVRFAKPQRANAHFPSLLGRDVLSYYRLTFEQRSGTVSLE